MNRSIFTITIILTITLLSAGCGRVPEGDDIVLASIGDTRITVGDFNERISNLPERYREIVRKRKDEYLRELINDTLLYQEALRQGIHKDREVRKVIHEAEKKILVAKLVSNEVEENIEITEEDIQDFYEANIQRYMTPEVLRVSHILVPDKEQADAIALKIAEGESFDDLARARSVDPTAQRGGDIGYFPRGQLMPEFENACADLKIGQVSGPVRTSLGYHIIMLTDRIEPRYRPVENVREDIKARLYDIKHRKAFNDLLSGLKEKTKIVIDQDALEK